MCSSTVIGLIHESKIFNLQTDFSLKPVLLCILFKINKTTHEEYAIAFMSEMDSFYVRDLSAWASPSTLVGYGSKGRVWVISHLLIRLSLLWDFFPLSLTTQEWPHCTSTLSCWYCRAPASLAGSSATVCEHLQPFCSFLEITCPPFPASSWKQHRQLIAPGYG